MKGYQRLCTLLGIALCTVAMAAASPPDKSPALATKINVEYRQDPSPGPQIPVSFSGIWGFKSRHLDAVAETNKEVLTKDGKAVLTAFVFAGMDTQTTKGVAGAGVKHNWHVLDKVDAHLGLAAIFGNGQKPEGAAEIGFEYKP